MSNKNISGNIFDVKILNRLFIFCKPYMGVFYALIFLTLSLSVLQPIRPYITQIIIDDYVSLNDLNGLRNMIFLLFGLLLVFTFEVIVISCMVYILSIPISIYHYMKLKKKYSITSGNEDDELEDVL